MSKTAVTAVAEAPPPPKQKKHYLNNDEFEALLKKYKRTKEQKLLIEICKIFELIAKKTVNKAINNIYGRVSGVFSMPNHMDREDVIQTAISYGIHAINYWKPNKQGKKGRCKAFNFFTSVIIYELQNEMKRELRKGWNRSPILSRQFMINKCQREGITETFKDYENEAEGNENWE